MIFAHAGALAFMAFGVPAGGRADFLFSIRLDDVELAMTGENSRYEIVEPGLRQFPALVLTVPIWPCASIVSQPGVVVVGVRHFDHQLMPSAFAQQDRNAVLSPHIRQAGRIGL